MQRGANSSEQDVVFVEASQEVSQEASRETRRETPREMARRVETAPAHGALDGGRAIVGMTGQYTLRNWRDASGNPRVFTCSVLKISPQSIVLSAPVKGAVGEWVCVHFGTLGKFEGPIVRIAQRSFVMKIVSTAEEAGTLAGKIAWIENGTAANGRRHTRFVPLEARSIVKLANGAVLPCHIIDYSVSGTAVIAELEPDVGVVVKVGKVIGRVVRRFAGGFAVEFASVQDGGSVEQLIIHHA